MNGNSPALLLHVCCAPCGSACVERLLAEGRRIALLFSNSNIVSREEFEKRLACVKRLADYHKLELIVDPYDHEAWLKHVSELPDFEAAPEGGARCVKCFEWSLRRTAELARSRGMNFTTTLTVSPHKNSKLIFSVGARWNHYESYDFKKKDGFFRSLELSTQFGFYRQAFCGCEYSLQGRELIKKTVC